MTLNYFDITKSYTDLEQSKNLAEILPIESADMTWGKIAESLTEDFTWKPTVGLDRAIKDNLFSYRNGYVLPCWSLAALLKLIPKEQHPILMLNAHYKWVCAICKPISFTYKPTVGDNPLEAVFEMLCYLKENKLL